MLHKEFSRMPQNSQFFQLLSPMLTKETFMVAKPWIYHDGHSLKQKFF